MLPILTGLLKSRFIPQRLSKPLIARLGRKADSRPAPASRTAERGSTRPSARLSANNVSHAFGRSGCIGRPALSNDVAAKSTCIELRRALFVWLVTNSLILFSSDVDGLHSDIGVNG